MSSDLLTWRQRGQLWLRLGIRLVLVAAVVLLAIYALPRLLSLLTPFVVILILAWVLNPLVRWLKSKLPASRKIITLLLLILVYGMVGGLLYVLVRALFGQIRSFTENWTPIVNSVTAAITSAEDWLRNLSDKLPAGIISTGDSLLSTILGWLKGLNISSYLRSAAGQATDFVSGLPSFAIATLVFVMGSYFVISDYPALRYTVTEQVPKPLRDFCGQVRDIFIAAFGGYIKSQFLISIVVFGILIVGFLLMRQPYGLLLAVGLAILDFIPIIGSGTVMVPWAIIDLITGNYRNALWLMGIWGVIAVFRRVAEPKVLGDQTGLSPILSLVGIYVGMRLGGVPGMILGPTLLLVIINVSKLGVFRPAVSDLRMAVRDLSAVLKGGVPPQNGGGDPPEN